MESRCCWKGGHRFGKHCNRFLILTYSDKMQRKSLPVPHEVGSESGGLACEIDKDLRILRHVARHQVPKHQRPSMFSMFSVFREPHPAYPGRPFQGQEVPIPSCRSTEPNTFFSAI